MTFYGIDAGFRNFNCSPRTRRTASHLRGSAVRLANTAPGCASRSGFSRLTAAQQRPLPLLQPLAGLRYRTGLLSMMSTIPLVHIAWPSTGCTDHVMAARFSDG